MKTLITEEQLREGIRRLAGEILKRYQGRPLTLVGVNVGSVMLLADLIRLLDMPLRMGLLQAVSDSQEGRPGPLVINANVLGADVRSRDVLLIDDIFATGRTLWELIPQIDEFGPVSVRTAVLLRKQGRCEVSLKPDFVGFDVPPDVFVVGYGLGYRDRFRSLPHLAVLEPEELARESGR